MIAPLAFAEAGDFSMDMAGWQLRPSAQDITGFYPLPYATLGEADIAMLL